MVCDHTISNKELHCLVIQFKGVFISKVINLWSQTLKACTGMYNDVKQPIGRHLSHTFSPCMYSYPSYLHSWERTSSSKSCFRRMRSVMSGPKQQPPPLNVFGLQPGIGLGSLHNRSKILNEIALCQNLANTGDTRLSQKIY